MNPAKAPKTRRELLDYDPAYLRFLKKNHPEEYQLLLQFTDEYVGASIKKKPNGQVRPGYVHRTQAQAKDCMDRNNRRNNDVISVTRANHLLSNIDAEINRNDGWYITNVDLTEDALLTSIEAKETEDDILSFEEYIKVKGQLTPEMTSFYEALYGELDKELGE